MQPFEFENRAVIALGGIEQQRNGKITWNNPLLELHYPVKWDWNAH